MLSLPRISRIGLFALFVAAAACESAAARSGGLLEVLVTDEETGKPLPVRMELTNSRGRPVRVRAEGVVTRDSYFVFDGQITLELAKGAYRFNLDAGPEYQTRQGHFTIDRHAEDSTHVTLKRYVNMAEEGWWAGDLDVRERAEDLPKLMQAARVAYAPRHVRENIQGKYKKPLNPEFDESSLAMALDYRRGGGLLLFGEGGRLFSQLELQKLERDASSLSTIDSAAEEDADVVALTPYAWDLPLWIAADRLTAVQVLHRQTWPDKRHPNEGWGKRRNKSLYPGKQGNGVYSETIYHHLLNCGIRIPPAAGSGSGSNSLPVGLNRVYVDCGTEYSEAEWFAGLRSGRVVITNGPLLRVNVEGQSPGHVFHLDRDEQRSFQIALSLSFYERAPVEYLEIVKNGRVEVNIRLSDLAKKKGQLPPLEFDASGWFLVRAITSSTETYQYASTGPYYVEQNYQPRISRERVEYFLNWLDAAKQEFAGNEPVLQEINEAEPFWKELQDRATVD